MQLQHLERIEITATEAFQLIKDEHLVSHVHTHQTWAGSRTLRSSYRQVVFSDCVFYGSEFQGVTFENCIFENCNFSFTHLRNCKFKNCSFHHCQWQACSSTLSVFEYCELDQGLGSLVQDHDNQVICEDHERTADFSMEGFLVAA